MLSSIPCFWPPPPLPTCTLQVTHCCFLLQTLPSPYLMLMFAWASFLQLSQQDPPPAAPGLSLTVSVYFHSLQLERWREAQKTKVKGISNLHPGEMDDLEYAHMRTCPHYGLALSSGVMSSKGGRGWDLASSVFSLPLMCCVTLNMSSGLSWPQLP